MELCQPVEGDSIYRDFLMEHGEGLHHMNFLVDGLDEITKILVKESFPNLESGHWGPPKCDGAYSYIDISPLHTIWEHDHESESTNVEPRHYP